VVEGEVPAPTEAISKINEAPWLVNGGHGASFRNHTWAASPMTRRWTQQEGLRRGSAALDEAGGGGGVARGERVQGIGLQWVQSPRHGDPTANHARGERGEACRLVHHGLVGKQGDRRRLVGLVDWGVARRRLSIRLGGTVAEEPVRESHVLREWDAQVAVEAVGGRELHVALSKVPLR
jgi:hypothetical protein